MKGGESLFETVTLATDVQLRHKPCPALLPGRPLAGHHFDRSKVSTAQRRPVLQFLPPTRNPPDPTLQFTQVSIPWEVESYPCAVLASNLLVSYPLRELPYNRITVATLVTTPSLLHQVTISLLY